MRRHLAHHALDFLTQKLAHGEDHLLLLVQQPLDRGILLVQTLSARRHGIADVLSALGVILDAYITQIKCLLEVDRILVALRSGGKNRHDLVVKGVLDIPGGRAGIIAAEHVGVACDHSVAGVVVIDRDRLAIGRFELDHRHGLVRRTIVVGAFPPLVGLAVDDVAVDVYVGNARPVTDARRLELFLGCLYDVEYLIGGSSGGAVGVRRIHDQILGGDAQLFFDSLRHSPPYLFSKHARIRRNQGRAGGAVIDHDRPGVDVVEDSLAVFRQLSGRDIDFSRTHPERRSRGLRKNATRKHGDQNC